MKTAKLTSDIILSYIESELFGIQNNINNKNDYKIGAELEIFTLKKKN